jgi:fructosamine-3-kinase
VTAAGPGGVTAQLEELLGTRLRDCRNLGGQHGVGHYRCVLADGRIAFAKVAGPQLNAARAGFGAEARGLSWLGEAGAVPVPAVLGWDDGALVISWVRAERAERRAAARFGRELALLHAAGAPGYGAWWPGTIAGLPLPNEALPNEALPNRGRPVGARPTDAGPDWMRPDGVRPDGAGENWPEWYAAQRLLPYLRLAVDARTFSAADARLVETVATRAAELAGPAEPPSRIHGDCWSGNLLWSGGRGVLIDPAAHGGHRETDLAMLALFGAPFLDQIVASYQEVAPLATGWQARVPLHQLHPLLVHVCLFGAAYRDAALDAARSVLAIG